MNNRIPIDLICICVCVVAMLAVVIYFNSNLQNSSLCYKEYNTRAWKKVDGQVLCEVRINYWEKLSVNHE